MPQRERELTVQLTCVIWFIFRATLPMSMSNQVTDVEDKVSTLTMNDAAEADKWLRDNGKLMQFGPVLFIYPTYFYLPFLKDSKEWLKFLLGLLKICWSFFQVLECSCFSGFLKIFWDSDFLGLLWYPFVILSGIHLNCFFRFLD